MKAHINSGHCPQGVTEPSYKPGNRPGSTITTTTLASPTTTHDAIIPALIANSAASNEIHGLVVLALALFTIVVT